MMSELKTRRMFRHRGPGRMSPLATLRPPPDMQVQASTSAGAFTPTRLRAGLHGIRTGYVLILMPLRANTYYTSGGGPATG